MEFLKSAPDGTVLLHSVHDTRADPAGNAVRGGGVTRIRDWLFHRSLSYLVVTLLLVRNNPASPCRSSRKWQDGSDPPPFLPLYRHAGRGGVTAGVPPPAPSLLGVAPVQLIPAGRLRTRTPSLC